ncbi:hypothetical protein KP509_01G015600 [Ceratopteris richardii]|nr:hypothetical protein KP509_01G015600 [Ceratopteris richardii]
MLVFFIVVFFLILVNESTLAFSLPQDFNFLLLGFSFSVESFVAVCSATDPNLLFELESFRILAALAGFSALTCFLLAWKPVSFMVSITFSASLALQGSWLLQMGLSLYSDEFLPEGCHHLSNGHTQCDIAVADHRAVALMDLLLIIHIICILLVFVAAYGISYRKPGHTRRHSGYEFVDGNGEVDQLQMRQLPTKVVID